jgi:hypothetical protein
METLTLGGKQYVKATKAARDLGYAADYVGQLCRTGKIDAHLVGRTWYVNVDMLGAHRVEKKRNARVKAREYAKKSIEEARTLNIEESTKGYKNIAIRYKSDDSGPIPELKKVHVASEKFVAPHNDVETNDDASYEILNKDKKIIMSGAIPVFDAEEETVLTDTVILSPRIQRKRSEAPKPATQRQEKGVLRINVREDEDTDAESSVSVHPGREDSPVTTFEEKLIAQEGLINQTTPEVAGAVPVDAVDEQIVETHHYLSRSILVVSIILALFSVGGLFTDMRTMYQQGGVEEEYVFTTELVREFTLKYIGISF